MADAWREAVRRRPINDAYTNTLGEHNPTLTRRANRLSGELGIPPEVVSADVDGFEAEANNQQAKTLFEYAPGLAQFAAQPNNAAAIKDDLPSMGEISKILGMAPPEETLSQKYIKALRGGTALKGPLRERGETLSRPSELARLPAHPGGFAAGIYSRLMTSGMRMGTAAAEVVAHTFGQDEALRQTGAWQNLQTDTARLEYQQAIPWQPWGHIKVPGLEKPISINPVQGLYSGAQSVAQLAVGRGVGLGAKGTLGYLSATSGADQYAVSRARGESVGEALQAGLLSGTIEYATEKAPLEFMFGKWGKEGLGSFVRGLLAREIPSELLATTGQTLVDAMGSGGEGLEAWAKNLPQNLADTVLATVAMVGITGGAQAIHNRRAKAFQDAADATSGAAFLDAVMRNAEDSKVRTEDPATFKAFVDQHAKDTVARNVYFNTEAVATFMQSEGYDGSFDRFKQQVTEALAQGQTDVVLPIGEVATHLAKTSAWENLKDEARIKAGGISMREAREEMEDLEQFEKLGEEMRDRSIDDTEFNEVVEHAKQRWLATGRVQPNVAEAVAKIEAANAQMLSKTARAKGEDVTPLEMFKRYAPGAMGIDEQGRPIGGVVPPAADRPAAPTKPAPPPPVTGPARTGAQIAAHPAVERVDDGGPGQYFISLKPGYVFDFGQGSANFDTKKEAAAAMKNVRPMTEEEFDAYAAENELPAPEAETEEEEAGRVLGQARNTAGWTDDRINQLVRQYAVSHDTNKTKSHVAWITPQQFLDVTTPESERAKLEGEAGELDVAKLAGEIQTPFLIVEGEGSALQVKGHEGRHRMAALAAAGVTRVPVVIQHRDIGWSALEAISTATLAAQTYGGTSAQADITLTNLEPLTYDNKATLKQEFGSSEAGRVLFQAPMDLPPLPPEEEVAALTNAARVASQRNWPNQRTFKMAMQDLIRAATTALRDPARLVRLAFYDAKQALQSNQTAVGWYDEKVRQALAVLGILHPEILTEPGAKFAFIYALSVTSNGLKVDDNFNLALRAYRGWRETGRMPAMGIGKSRIAMNKALNLFNDLVEQFGGLEEARDFLLTPRTAREFGKMGYKINGENQDTIVIGAAMFGPKIGNGFFANLYQQFDALTMDRWFMRSWGRWTGTLVVVDPKLIAKNRADLKTLLRALTPAEKKAIEAILSTPKKPFKIKVSEPDAFAQRMQTVTTKEANRELLLQTPTGDELRRAGNRLNGNIDGQKEQPKNGTERNEIRSIMQPVLELLQEEYPDLNMADLQALLWYPEKLLYDSATSEVEKTAYEEDDIPDYANAAVTLALSEGIPREQIDAVLERVNADIARDRAGSGQRGFRSDVLPHAGWLPQRLSGLIDRFGLDDGSSTAVAVMMTPDEYLGALASERGRDLIAARVLQMPEYGPLNIDTLRASGPPIITIAMTPGGDRSGPLVRGHDGRHRVEMLKQAGVERFPVVIQLMDKDARPITVSEPLSLENVVPNRSREQVEMGDRPITFEGGIPISWKYEGQLQGLSGGARVLYQGLEEVFYSALQQAIVQSKTTKASGQQWIATLKKAPGVKQEELELTGIIEMLEMSEGPVSQQDLLVLFEAKGIHIEEEILGGPPDLSDPLMQRAVREAREEWLSTQEDYLDFGEFEVVDANRRYLIYNDPNAVAPFFVVHTENMYDVRGEYPTQQEAELAARQLVRDERAANRARLEAQWDAYSDEEKLERAINSGIPLPKLKTKYASYSTDPGNKDYRELLITVPLGVRGNPLQSPRDPHWDTKAVVAHVRFNSQLDIEGKRVLFVEEIQSDWHQKARNVAAARREKAEDALFDHVGMTSYQYPKRGDRARVASEIAEQLGAEHPLVAEYQEAKAWKGFNAPPNPATVAEAKRQMDEAYEAWMRAAKSTGRATKVVLEDLRPFIERAAAAMRARYKPQEGERGLQRQANAEVWERQVRTRFNLMYFEPGFEGYISPNNLLDLKYKATQELIIAGEDVGASIEQATADHMELAQEFHRFESVEQNRFAARERSYDLARQSRGVPDAPFKTSWEALLMKRMIRWAAENGFDKIAWTTGEEQNRRYNLAEATGPVFIKVGKDGRYHINMDSGAKNQLVNNDLAEWDPDSATSLFGERSLLMTKAQISEAFGQTAGDAILETGNAQTPEVEQANAERIEAERAALEEQLRTLKVELIEGAVKGLTERKTALGTQAYSERHARSEVENMSDFEKARAAGLDYDADYRLKFAHITYSLEQLRLELLNVNRGAQVPIDDLQVGGEGMKFFYEKKLINVTNSLIKKYDSKVEPVYLATVQQRDTAELVESIRDDIADLEQQIALAKKIQDPQWHIDGLEAQLFRRQTNLMAAEEKLEKVKGEAHPGFDITPKMVEAAMGGQALFQRPPEGAKGRIRILDDGRKIIELFATADMSTLIHEIGHAWLEDLQARANAPDAPQWVKDDWAAVQKWFADNGMFVTAAGQIPTPAHEMWARGHERFYMEGKAPTAKLQPVFKRFWAWLTRIYEVVENLNAPITPEIRDVMSRMVATQEAIDEFRAAQNIKPAWKTAEEAGMSEAAFADYQKTIADASDEAHATLLFKMMEKIRKAKTSEQKKRRAAIKADVAVSIGQQPEFVALHLLRTGRWLGDPEREKTPVKLNTGWLQDTYGPEIFDQLPKGLQLHKGNGEDADTIAELVGMNSGSELVEALVAMAKASADLKAQGEQRRLRDKLVDDETDRQMADQYGDPMTDGSIEEEAIAALNTAAQGEILSSELRQLQKKTSLPTRVTPYQFVRDWAKRLTSASRVRDVATRGIMQAHTRGAAKAARAFEKALLEGDHDEAYRQKQKQLIHHAQLAESKIAADKVDKIVSRMQRISKRAAMASVHPDYFDRVKAMLETFDFRPRTMKYLDEVAGFQKWAEDQRAKGYEVYVPPRLNMEAKHFMDMTIEELEALDDVVQSLMAVGRTRQKLKIAGELRAYEEWRDEALAHMEQLPNRKLPDSPVGERRRALAAGAAEILKVETLAEELDGGTSGPMHDLLVNAPADAESTRITLREKALAPLTKLYLALPRKMWKRLQEKVTAPELTWNTVKEGDATETSRLGQPVTMTRMQWIGVALNTGNLSNLEKMSKGEKWAIDDIRAVLDRVLNKEEWDFVQKMWTQVELLWPDIVAVERELSGVTPEKVVNNPIETKYGTYEGGYWPVVYDASRWTKAEELQDKQLDDMFGLSSGVATQKGHTITRTGFFGPMDYSIENVLFNHIEQVITRIAYAPLARDVMRMLRDPKITGMIYSKLGREYLGIIQPWLQRQITQGAVLTKGAKWWDSMMRQMRINMTIAAMGFRWSTLIAQTVGLTASAQRIGARWVGTGFKTMLLNPRKSTQFVWDRSPEMVHRVDSMHREIVELAIKMRGTRNFSKLSRAQQKVAEAQYWSLFMIGMVDRYMVSVPTWLGAHAKGIAQGMTDEQASRFADKTVRMSQGSGREKDLANLQSLSQGEVWKFFTMFYTPFNVLFQAQWQGIRGLRKGDVKPAITVTFWWLMASVLADALMSGDWPEDEDEDGGVDWGAWFVRNVGFGLFAGIPLLRDVANFMERRMIGEYADLGSNPAVRTLEAGARVASIAETYAEEGELPDDPIKTGANLTAILTGLPIGQAGTTGQFLWDYSEGTTDPQGPADWYYGLTKDKVPSEEGASQ